MKPIDNACVEEISKILGNLTSGSEISNILSRYKWKDYDIELKRPFTSTKWRRINESMIYEINKVNDTKPFFRIIEVIMNPIRFNDNEETWRSSLKNINFALRFYGYEVSDAGKVIPVTPTKTYNDAVKRSKHLIEKLESHSIHKNIIKFCAPELLKENYFHAIFEASKSVFERVRDLTISSKDGNSLINEAFNPNNPAIIINGNYLKSNDEKGQYNGLKSLLNTICYIYRNPGAHSPKLYSPKSEIDAITALILISMAHQQLDQCISVRTLN